MKCMITRFLLFSLILLSSAHAADFRMRAMGNTRLALPDADNRLNLYRYAGNMAVLQQNDSTSWAKYRYNSAAVWGNLRRPWDSAEDDLSAFAFIGQKRLSKTQLFYGSVQYEYRLLRRLSNAIDPEPYDLDPFVLTDSTTGNFTYSGPHVFVAYNQQLWSKAWWGLSLDYQINRGLKDEYTRPEIIRRAIHFGLDLACLLGSSWTVGLSFRPYDIQDISKLVKQPDGQSPLVFRYRGEYTFNAVLGGSNRTARYNGYEIAPQLAYHSPRLKGVIGISYFYRWLELFDGTTVQNYNGYYQGERYTFNTAWRYLPLNKRAATVAIGYNFTYISGWAREPIAGFEIYRAFYHQQQIIAGVSYPWQNLPFVSVAEIQYEYKLPDRRDYLAHIVRHGAIQDARLRIGGEWQVTQNKFIQAGCIVQQYNENSVWRYFGNYRGAALTFGVAYRNTATVFEFFGYFGHLAGQTYGARQRNQMNFFIQIKQLLN